MAYLYLLMVLSMCGWAQAQLNATNICTGHEHNTLLRDLANCNKYYVCVNGVPESRDCQYLAQFDPVALECNYRNFECFRCPMDPYFDDVPVDHECLQFVRCFGGTGVQHTCSEGLLFDPVLKQCNIAQHVVCACPVVDIPGRPLFVRSWTNCSNYHVCANGQPIENHCAEGLNFNLESRQCDHDYNVDCNSTSTNWVFNELNNI